MGLDREAWLQRVVGLGGLCAFEWHVDAGTIVPEPPCLKLLDYQRGEFPSRLSSLLEHIHVEDRRHVHAGLSGVRCGALETFRRAIRIRTRGGAWKWVELSCELALHAEDDASLKILGVFRDISRARAQREELVHARKSLEQSLEAMPGAFYQRTHGPEWTTLFLSKQFNEISGLSVQDFMEQRRSLKSLVLEADRADVDLQLDDALEHGDEYTLRYRVSFGGSERWMLDRGRAYRDPVTHEVTHLIGAWQDVTEQHSQGEQLELIKTVVENANDGVIITEAEPFGKPGPRILYVNEAQCRISGYSRAELLGNTPRILQGPETSLETLAEIRRGLEAWSPIQVEVRNHRKDGTGYWSELSIVPIADASGWYTHWVSVQRDITARKAHEEELRKAMETAEQATVAKSQFLATMSHEIRTPLNGVIGMTSMLRETALDEEQRDYLETIRFSGDALLSLINDILDFSKIESGGIELEETVFELHQAMEECLEMVAPRARGKGLEFGYVATEDVPLWVRGDIVRFRQILVNLLGNAVKFTERGFIRVDADAMRLDTTGRVQLRIEVEDTGIGIDEEAMKRLFRPFTQADASTTRRFGGTGLGLAICKDLTRLMGGDIGVSSVYGEGSTFWFEVAFQAVEQAPSEFEKEVASALDGAAVAMHLVPGLARDFSSAVLRRLGARIVEPGEASAVARWGDEAPGGLIFSGQPDSDDAEWGGFRWPLRRRSVLRAMARHLDLALPQQDSEDPELTGDFGVASLRVLLVDDNVVNQKVALAMLRRLGLEPAVAVNGAEALEMMEQSDFDLVLMDMQMPVMDGPSATRAVRSRPDLHQPFVVALTANAMESDVRICMDSGMDHFLSKPIRIGALRSAMLEAVKARSGRV